ncbi:hypothetical protein LDENG_00020140 [Lucifuga dentata]|nr:hypothetical protein LDENG_00020140 [Lucifuga dentata]
MDLLVVLSLLRFNFSFGESTLLAHHLRLDAHFLLGLAWGRSSAGRAGEQHHLCCSPALQINSYRAGRSSETWS